jgi:hypothetical protein
MLAADAAVAGTCAAAVARVQVLALFVALLQVCDERLIHQLRCQACEPACSNSNTDVGSLSTCCSDNQNINTRCRCVSQAVAGIS